MDNFIFTSTKKKKKNDAIALSYRQGILDKGYNPTNNRRNIHIYSMSNKYMRYIYSTTYIAHPF